jgi:phospholipase C
MDRRTFVKGAAAGIGAAALGATKARADQPNLVLPSLGLEPKPPRTPIDHLVVVMMENRSADHYLGWYAKENPAFDGTQTRSFVDRREGMGDVVRHTASWGAHGRNDYNARFFRDPDHGWDGGRYQRNGGQMDQWLGPGTHNDEFALSYYDAVDLPIWAQLARGWQTYDRWFCALLGPTQPNRYYLYSGQSAGLKGNSLPPELAGTHKSWLLGWDWPTVWDLCSNGGVSASYFFSNLPETAFWGARQLWRTHHVAEFYAQCATGTLPQVSIIDPWFTGPSGIANDDHPLADIRLGQAFLSDIVEAFTSSIHYQNGALVITYDEWGGFWDHVPPPRTPDSRATDDDPGGDDDFGQLGFRIPSTIVSPWTRGDAVDHTVYNHASILRFISDNWGLPYLTKRVQHSNSIETAFRGFQTFDPHHGVLPYDIPIDRQLEMVIDATRDQLEQGQVPRVIPSSVHAPEPPQSDLHRLAETGWFDHLKVNIDHRFEDGFLRPSNIVQALARQAGVGV